MNQTVKTILISVAVTLVVIAIVFTAVWWFSPMRGTGFGMGSGMFGDPMSGGVQNADGLVQFGPMGRGMMNEMGAMADIDSEYDYMSSMIPHHEEAVQNARILRDRTNRAEMREFAQDIIEVQSREIDQMTEWLERWYPDRPARADYEPMMGDYTGMNGDELDVGFLQDMIPHHMAAVMMSQQLLGGRLAEHDQVAELARGIRDAQLREIRRMSDWLQAY